MVTLSVVVGTKSVFGDIIGGCRRIGGGEPINNWRPVTGCIGRLGGGDDEDDDDRASGGGLRPRAMRRSLAHLKPNTVDGPATSSDEEVGSILKNSAILNL